LFEKAALAKGIVLVLALLAVPLALAACGGGASSATSGQGSGKASTVAAKTPPALCQALNAVLSDGPDPGADPVGYALSQILPLQQQVHSSDTAVMATVDQLIAADQAFYDTKGDDKSAAATIQKDYAALNRACPGVAP
jgi:hypothetical protein